MPKKGKHKRTKEEVLRDREIISEWYLKGKYQAEIAVLLKEKTNADYTITQQQISLDLKAIRKEWLESSIRNFDEVKAEELAKVDQLERTYWDAWSMSLKLESKTLKGKKGSAHSNTDMEQIIKTEEKIGEPRFLQGIQWCIDRRCKIFGLDAPQKFQGEINNKQAIKFGEQIIEF